jgi:hypothetical protein
MLQIGQSPESGWRIWGCIEQVHICVLSQAVFSVWRDGSIFGGKPNHQPAKNKLMSNRVVSGFEMMNLNESKILEFVDMMGG